MTTLRVPAEQEPEQTVEAAGSAGDAQQGRPTAWRARGLLDGKGKGVRGEFARYVVVGGIAFVCDAGTLFSLTRFLKVNYLISAPIGFTLGIAVNYLLSRTWVFERRRLQSTSVEVTIFTLIGVVGLGLNEMILWFFQSRLGIYYMFAKGVSGCVVLVWNFGARKLALFR